MKPGCPRLKCSSHENRGPNTGSVIANGSFFRACDSRRVRRFICRSCGLNFSQSTGTSRYRQKKRRLVQPLYRLMASTVSQRRAARLLGVDKKTIVRYFRFISSECKRREKVRILSYRKHRLKTVQFDDLETLEHTKLKPLSVALAVDPNTRKILGFHVSRMPAKGLLSKKSIQKYGPRKDERNRGWNHLLKNLVPIVAADADFLSDQNPHYPQVLNQYFPSAKHVTTPGGRGAITGQGELKKLSFDPLFALNHTCAMMRANMSRLLRRTWCTTKTLQGLQDHLAIYVDYHNRILTRD